MNKKRIVMLFSIVLLVLSLCVCNTFAAEKILFDWNEPDASGTNWPGWTWKDNAAYGQPGWWKDDGKFFSGNWLPRSHNKGRNDRHGSIDLALIDPDDRAPSSSRGSCLKVYDHTTDTIHRAGWWVLLGDGPLYLRNITDANTDRMSFYLKTEGTIPIQESANRFPNYNFHVGTYLCWGDYISKAKEGPGNQHYYHHLVVNPGTWIHVEIDQHPMHRRGVHGSVTPYNDPSFVASSKHYFEHLLTFYMEVTHPSPNLTSYNVDEIKFYSTKDTYEPNQNDISITTPWVGYWQDKDYWEMGWQDGSWYNGLNDYTGSTFDVRWSIFPITNENFDSANKINPELFAVNGTNLVRRPHAWSRTAWTRFKLTDYIEQNYNHIYFAIKDVSVKGGHKASWPYIHGDGHDAPNSLIHTIDYYLRPDRSNFNQPPTASLSATPPNGVAPLEVSFSAADSSDADGEIVSCLWSFGDDNSDTDTGMEVTHTYTDSGSYQAILTVVDDDNVSATAQTTITVNDYGKETITFQEGLYGYSDSGAGLLFSRDTDCCYYSATWRGRIGEYAGINRLVVKFDNISEEIPDGAIITEAKLKLYQYQNYRATNHVIEAYPLYRDWYEKGVSWNNCGVESCWEVPGAEGTGDRASEPVASVTLDNQINLWREWDITSLVQSWLSGTISNYGILLKERNETTGHSRYIMDNDSDTEHRPVLEIGYYIP